jgi:hypothetical protein
MTKLDSHPEAPGIATTAVGPTQSQVLGDEHIDLIKKSWELPAYERPVERTKSHRTLLVGLVSAGLGLAVGFGLGVWVEAARTTAPTQAAPVVASALATGPVDANGMTLGRRVPGFETGITTETVAAAPVDSNGMTLGRRVPAFEVGVPAALAALRTVDANGMNLGRRVPAFETSATATAVPAAAVDSNGMTLGRRVPAA